ncbi:MAG: type II secretion system secretin GspD [Candidatus Dadabacteria bacterium]|nr:type II secretion system secretin GspD [Candidatus Dadabacteria bacterium]NIS07361.1 type II secretion system secretin GspD [Candidatus Dadabacteria bacterium]NIV41305.1 type II secretion system secretin GspD [Candidatus Dadabacteria bacterium]NIX14540.1 type II secretion system secretin GspD [Candidatus Dadabacteria bacterium]NIY20998.1 type II secretion system secretin GspD [Candidatus Dadabacteria bacterium]
MLAEKYNTTSKEIRALNNLERNQIGIGQKLKIPNMPPSSYMTYWVQSGDSLSVLAENHGITTKDLMELNALERKQINIGQRLKLPKKPGKQGIEQNAGKEVAVAKANKTDTKTGQNSNDGPFQIAASKEEIIVGIGSKKDKAEQKKVTESKTQKAVVEIAKSDKNVNNKSKLENASKKPEPAERRVEIDKKKTVASLDNKVEKQGKQEKQADAKPAVKQVTKADLKPDTKTEELKAQDTAKEKSEEPKEVAGTVSKAKDTAKTTKTEPKDSKFITYVVESGDSVSYLAEEFNTSSAEIRKLNNLKDNNIKIGQKLQIAKMPPSPYLKYKVQSGDSLSILAENHGITTKEAMELNGLATKQINIGQILKFPKETESNNKDKEVTLAAKTGVQKNEAKEEKSTEIDAKQEIKNNIVNEEKKAKKEIKASKKTTNVAKSTKKLADSKELIKAEEVKTQEAAVKEKPVKDKKSETVAKVEKPKVAEADEKIADHKSAEKVEKRKAIKTASKKKKEIESENKAEANNTDLEKAVAVNKVSEDSGTNNNKEKIEEAASLKEPKTEKLVYRQQEQENVNDEVTLAQLLTIENSNIPEEEIRYENLIDDQIMLAAGKNEQRYDTFAQSSTDAKPARSDLKRSKDIEATVNIPDEIDLRDFVRTISEITGESYILDDKLKSKKVTIVTPEGGFSKKNAIRLFGAILHINGYTVYKKGILNVITESRNIKQKDIQVIKGRIITDPSDSFVTQIIPLKNISALNVANTLKPLVSREGDIVVHAPLNTLIIVETESNLERLINILDNIDKEKDIIFVKIYNSEASDIAAMLTEIFGGQSASPISTTDGDRGERRASRRASAARRAAAASGQTEIAGFKIITDERTNSLIVIAYPEDMPKIKAAIERLDVEVDEPEHGIYVIRLKNGDSEQIVNVLNSLITGAAGTTSRTSRGFAATRERQAQRNEDARGGAQRTSASGAIAEFSLEDIRITSDVSTNSIIVVGSRREFEAIKRVVDELDIRRRQVFVEAAILEVSLDQLKSLGTNLSIGFTINDDNLGFGGTNLPGVPSLLGAAADTENTVSLVGSLSGMFLGVVGEEVDPDGSGPIPPIPSFSALFQALTSVTDVNILSTPSIVTTDNEEAEIVVADVIPFPTGSTVGDSGVTVQTIDRQPVGIRLAITPQIGDGDFLNLEIQTEVSSVRDAPTDLNTQDFGIATTTRTASSSVVVKNGQTIVIGGLVQDRESLLENRVPGLGSVPVLGNLFKFKSKSSSKINLMILLTPRIIEDERDMKLILEDRQKRNMLLQQRGFDTEGVY